MDHKNNYIMYLPPHIKTAFCKINEQYLNRIHEIRLRINRPLALFLGSEVKYLTAEGELSYIEKSNAVVVTAHDIHQAFEAVCQYSIHSFQRELANGFITIQGGHRVGICGTAVSKNDNIESIKHISGLNFRISREILNCSDNIYNTVFSNGISNLLLAGVPSSGKTTILRDLCRNLGRKYKLSVIDERGEIASVYNGVPQNDIGINTDVFDGYSKKSGIETAIRVMSPQIIVCDEIGNENDEKLIERTVNCGVKLIATVHAADKKDILKKAFSYKHFEYIALLKDSCSAGQVKEIVRTDEIVKDIRMWSDNNDYGYDR